MGSDSGPPFTLASLRVDGDHDATLQNLLQALTLNFELRARYRTFEFEARQDRAEDSVRVFCKLWHGQGDQIADLLVALRRRLRQLERANDGEGPR